jgi:hydrogenase nickel incorporation protein HypA/HybF
MHELSIAQNIVEIVKENIPEKEQENVKTIFLEVGEFSGIVSDSLQFCFDIVKSETPFGKSVMKIKKIPFVIYCNDCNSETTNNMGIRFCEKCNSNNTGIISGTDMHITGIELES